MFRKDARHRKPRLSPVVSQPLCYHTTRLKLASGHSTTGGHESGEHPAAPAAAPAAAVSTFAAATETSAE